MVRTRSESSLQLAIFLIAHSDHRMSVHFKFLSSEICPNAGPTLCTNITSNESRSCDFSEVPFGTELTNLFAFLDGTLDLLFSELNVLTQDLKNLQQLLAKADDYYPQQATWAFWVAAGAALGMAAICLFYLIGIVLLARSEDKEALPAIFKSIRSWLFVPLFFLLTIVVWLFSMIFITMSIGTADMCINSPDGPVVSILRQLEDEFASVVYFFLVFYVKGCPVNELPLELEQRLQILSSYVFPAMENLISAIGEQQGPNDFNADCGTNLAPFLVIANAMSNQLCNLTQIIVSVRSLLSCQNWYPVYEEIFHEGVCYHATAGFSWAA